MADADVVAQHKTAQDLVIVAVVLVAAVVCRNWLLVGDTTLTEQPKPVSTDVSGESTTSEGK